MPLWNFLQVWFYDERYIPDFQFWSKLSCRFTKNIAKKLSSNEMSSLEASLALGNVLWKDALRGIQTSFDLWILSNLHTGLFGTSHTPAFPQRLWKGSRSSFRLYLYIWIWHREESWRKSTQAPELQKRSKIDVRRQTCLPWGLTSNLRSQTQARDLSVLDSKEEQARYSAGAPRYWCSGTSYCQSTPRTEHDWQKKNERCNMCIYVHTTHKKNHRKRV